MLDYEGNDFEFGPYEKNLSNNSIIRKFRDIIKKS